MVGRPSRALAPIESTRGWRVAFLVLCTVGLLLSSDLLRLHVNVHTDPDYRSYCAMSERVNCETVAASHYSVTAGLPVAVWGMIAYLFMGALAVWGLGSRLAPSSWPFGLLAVLSALASAVGVVLFVISHYVIESVCLVCVGTYMVNFALLGTALAELRRLGRSGPRAVAAELGAVRAAPWPVVALVALMAVGIVLLEATLPPYWRVELASGPGGLSSGTTAEGHPWIGAPEAVAEIVEYSDYQCPHCRSAHAEIRSTLAAYPDALRLVHRHYPLDHHCNPIVPRPFHERACEYARLAFCAGRQRRFWQANDLLYERAGEGRHVDPQVLAQAIGIDASALAACVAGEESARAIAEDLAAGRRLNIRGTPTFLFRGRTYPGRIPPEELAAALSTASP